MRIYLDNCCLNRPYDEQSQLRISLETQANYMFKTPAVFQSLLEQGLELFAVQGNNDIGWGDDLPHVLVVEIEGIRFLIVHDKKDAPEILGDTDVVVYGHSHKYDTETIDGVLWLNPGSCGKRRFHLDISYCRMSIKQGAYEYERVLITSRIKDISFTPWFCRMPTHRNKVYADLWVLLKQFGYIAF